jgi:hypothetical protein
MFNRSTDSSQNIAQFIKGQEQTIEEAYDEDREVAFKPSELQDPKNMQEQYQPIKLKSDEDFMFQMESISSKEEASKNKISSDNASAAGMLKGNYSFLLLFL